MLTKKTIMAATMAALLTTPAMAQSSMDHSAHAEGLMADYMATMDTRNL